ncbi:MAG: type II secretion system protein GspK [Verrucomicrobia subdivision 3 bacterium]|nr:type II secretion system protein GspK [Limisphaerales bacterium]
MDDSLTSSGFVLIAVLIVIMLASMVAISLLFRVRAEDTASAAGSGAEQATAAAMSGAQEAMRIAADVLAGSTEWRNNPGLFKDRLFHDDGIDKWYFTVFSPAEGEERGTVRFGLTDEASRLNINEAGEAMMARLPGLTPSQAQALWDFRDADSTARPEGAEQEYYDTLPTPYMVRNGPLASLDELLLVRGFSRSLVYGEDANQNFVLDPNEDDGPTLFPPDNGDGRLDSGLRGLLTVYSYDRNVDNDGVPRGNMNDPTARLYTNDLPEAVLQYISALRSNKVELMDVSELLEARATFKDAKGKEVELQSGVGKEELPLILDRFTTTRDEKLPGLININTASAAVLQTLPGLPEGVAEAIVVSRRGLTPDKLRTPAWLYQEGLASAAVFKIIAPFISTRSWQFTFQVIGYGLPSGRYRVWEMAIDVAGRAPTVTYMRDITRRGLPYRITAGDTGTAPSGMRKDV